MLTILSRASQLIVQSLDGIMSSGSNYGSTVVEHSRRFKLESLAKNQHFEDKLALKMIQEKQELAALLQGIDQAEITAAKSTVANWKSQVK